MLRRLEGEPEGQNLSDEERKAFLKATFGDKVEEIVELFNRFSHLEQTEKSHDDSVYDEILALRPGEIPSSQAKMVGLKYALRQYECDINVYAGAKYFGPPKEVFYSYVNGIYQVSRWHNAIEEARQNYWEPLSRELCKDGKDFIEGEDPEMKEMGSKLRLIGAKLHSLFLA